MRDYYERVRDRSRAPIAAIVLTANTTTTRGFSAAAGSVAMDGDMPSATSRRPPCRAALPLDAAHAAAGREEGGWRSRTCATSSRSGPRRPARPERQHAAEDGAIAIRSNFNPLAAFSPSVTTDASGKASVTIKLPDNLTRYRIVAIAVAGDRQFGKGESAVTARLPLMVRPSPPRFLNFGDTFKLPVVVQNQTDDAMTVRVAVRATNAKITDGAGREVTVPANDRVELQFPAAAELAGTARFQILGTSGSDGDAAEVALPVWTPATTEAFATYGVIDDGVQKQPVALPGEVVKQFGGLSVTTSSTNLQALTDAMLYLVHYPFECAEQRSSRVIAIAALKDVLTAFKTKDMPSQAAMEGSVKEDVEHLSQMQNYDGGFAFWDRGYPSEPYLSVFVASALGHAKAKGFAVPDVHPAARARVPQEHRAALSGLLHARGALGDQRVCAVHAQAARRSRHREGAEAVRRDRGGERREEGPDDGDRRRGCSGPVRGQIRRRASAPRSCATRRTTSARPPAPRTSRPATATATTCCSRATAASTR